MADLSISVTLDDSELQKHIDDVKKQFYEMGINAGKSIKQLNEENKNLNQSIKDLDDQFDKLQNRLISLYAAQKLINWLDWANNIEQTAKAVGMTTGELIGLQAAVMQAGGTALAASRGIEMFYMKLDQARQGGLMQQEAFKRVGISLEDLAKYDDQALFKKTIEALSAMPASAARNRLEVELLSKSFRGIPIQEINAQLDATKGKFEEFTPVLDDAGAAYRRLQQEYTNFKIALLAIIQPITQALGAGKSSVEEWIQSLRSLAAIIGGIIAYNFATKLIGTAVAVTELTTTIVKLVEALKILSIAEGIATFGLGTLVQAAVKWAAAIGGSLYIWKEVDDALAKNKDSNKAATEAAKEKAEADKKLQDNTVYDATAKMTAMIMQQTEAFKENIRAQIANIQARTSTIGLGEEEKAKMDEELKVRDEFRRKIEELNVKLAEAKAAGPSQEIYFQQGALTKAISDLSSVQDEYVKSAGNAALIKAKNNSLDQMTLLLKEDMIKIDKTIKDIELSTAELTMSNDEKKIANIQKQTNEYIRQATEKRRAQLGTSVSDEELSQDKTLQNIIAGIKKKQEETVNATKVEIAASREWSTGWTASFKQYVEDATNAAQEAKRVFDVATKGMEDMLVNFFHTGQLGWKNFLQTVVDEMLRSQIRQLIAKTFGGIGNAGGGGGIGSLLGFADGGIIPTNGPVLVGERGPELISGAAGRTVTPNNAMSGNNVTYNINAVDAMSFKQMLAADPTFLYAVTEQGRRRVPGG